MRPPLDPQQTARAVIASGHYHLGSNVQTISPWDRFWTWVWQILNKIFGRAAAPSGDALNLLGLIVLAAAIGVVIFAAVRLLMNLRGGASNDTAPGVRQLVPRIAAKAWYERAVAAAAAGHFRRAATFLFRAALTILDLRGYVHDDPSRTVNECTSELRTRAPQYAAGFAAVARFFTAALYAERSLGEQQWETARLAFEELFAAVTHAG